MKLEVRTMRTFTAVVSLLMIGLVPNAAWSMFALPQDVPAERLVRNVTAYVTEHPDDAAGF